MAIKASNQISVIDITDGYSVILTNESHTFIGTTSTVKGTQSAVTQILAMCGSKQVACSIGTVTAKGSSSLPTGISVVNDKDATSPTLTITATSAVSSGGTLNIPVQIGDVTINKLFSYTIAYTGATGAQGPSGTSVTVKSTSVTYQAGTSPTNAPTGTWNTSVPSVPEGQYLWTKTVVTYSDNKSTTAYSVARQGATGPQGSSGTSVTVKSTSVTYAVTGSNSQPADSAFTSTTMPSVGVGQYLWSKATTVFSDNKSITSYSVSRIGTDGKTGSTGASGKTTHFAYSTSADGKSNFNTSLFSGATYIGTYDDTTTADSTDPTKYKWTKLKGDKGDKGDQGPKGATGETGADAINLIITSSAGFIFKNTNIATTLTAHVYKGAAELSATQIAGLGTIKWYKDGGTSAVGTGTTLTISAGNVTNKASYVAQLEG